MAQRDFFKINFPYGIHKNNNGEWFAFNRDWMPLGSKNKTKVSFEDWKQQFVGVPYIGLNEKILIDLGGEKIKRDNNGEIYCVNFYGEGSNPMDEAKHWSIYSNKIKKIGRLKVKLANR